MERFSERLRQLCHILYDIAVLCDRHYHAGDIHLLKGILAEGGKVHVRRDRHHRNGIHISRGDPRHKIGRAGAAGRHADAHFSGRPGIAVRRMCRALLMACQDMMDLIAVFI